MNNALLEEPHERNNLNSADEVTNRLYRHVVVYGFDQRRIVQHLGFKAFKIKKERSKNKSKSFDSTF